MSTTHGYLMKVKQKSALAQVQEQNHLRRRTSFSDGQAEHENATVGQPAVGASSHVQGTIGVDHDVALPKPPSSTRGNVAVLEQCLRDLVNHQNWKKRFGPSGIHLFERNSGLNILLDEVAVQRAHWSRAPRQVSIALTNTCDLACPHCFAPKSRDKLRFDTVMGWLKELDAHGALGVGFGGGEPTLYPRFAELCQYAARNTTLSVSFTTHGHQIDRAMADRLRGSVHFIRVSMDGVNDTYESIRRRSFEALLSQLNVIQRISQFGINVVVNGRTIRELYDVARVAADSGARDLLLLPQERTHTIPAITAPVMQELRRWVDGYSGPLKLCISETHAEAFPTCDPLVAEHGLRAYAHIDATGTVKPTSYHATGITVGESGVLEALERLANDTVEDRR